MSLAELLKADLEDLDDDENEEEEMTAAANAAAAAAVATTTAASGRNEDHRFKKEELLYNDIEDVGMQVDDDKAAAAAVGGGKASGSSQTASSADKNSVKSQAKLLDSAQLNSAIERIAFYQRDENRQRNVGGVVEHDPEYKLIVEANNLTVEIDNEINVIHKFIRDKYSKRFPELESLVPNALDYIQTVRELGNEVNKAKNNERLLQVLTTATIMIVSVSASTTQGVPMSESELAYVNEACDISQRLGAIKSSIFDYVESRMHFIAPNLSAIVGASTAAKLMGIAGGLTNLSKMPACNILLLGQQKKTLSGFSTVQVLPHTGYIYYCEVVQKVPADLRRKVARIVAAKCTLAARIDSFHESHDGRLGSELRAEVNMRIEKLQEPPPVKQVKSLPAPLEQARKKRGGRRARKMKERMGTSDLRKQANRMTFGEIEEDAYQDDLNFSTGQIGKGGNGRIRSAQIDSKTKARISQKLQKTIQKQNQWGGTTTVRKNIAGTASSVAFTTLQGLEIVNPSLNASAEAAKGSQSQKYFSSASGFAKVSSVLPKT